MIRSPHFQHFVPLFRYFVAIISDSFTLISDTSQPLFSNIRTAMDALPSSIATDTPESTFRPHLRARLYVRAPVRARLPEGRTSRRPTAWRSRSTPTSRSTCVIQISTNDRRRGQGGCVRVRVCVCVVSLALSCAPHPFDVVAKSPPPNVSQHAPSSHHSAIAVATPCVRACVRARLCACACLRACLRACSRARLCVRAGARACLGHVRLGLVPRAAHKTMSQCR
jgi:hypothetical protein